MVLYLKYRPQKLEDLDLEAVRNKLVRTLSSSYLPHAFLFAGPKGTGKTSAARIVAKILNCEKRDKKKPSVQSTIHSPQSIVNIEPCNNCNSCISITEGRHLDIIEIDAASNRGIEEIRDLREKIKLAPSSAKYKVYIIDEVHMLTTEAFNALLKTLEEPPPHAVFILATTEPDKLPETIQSRCVKFTFQKATVSEVVHSLKRVIMGEKIKMDDNLLELIALHSEGSFRDATKILEQAASEEAATPEKILIILGRNTVSAEKFLKTLKYKKIKELLAIIVTMGQEGADFRFFVSNILFYLHDLLLVLHGVSNQKIPADIKDIFNKQEISNLIKLFSRVYVELKNASKPEIPLEIAIVEWCET